MSFYKHTEQKVCCNKNRNMLLHYKSTTLNATKIKCYTLEIIQVNLSIVSRDETLDLRSGKHMQPLWVDDAAEAPDKGSSLFLNLCVHPEVSHEVDVANPARDCEREAMSIQQSEWTTVLFQLNLN